MPVSPISNVDVYYNLHKRLWSCKCRSTGRVIQHARTVLTPYAASLIVREAGRQRAIAEQTKNVHAFARMGEADVCADTERMTAFAKGLPNVIKVSYNPYKAGHFYNVATDEAVKDVKSLIMVAPIQAAPEVWAVV